MTEAEKRIWIHVYAQFLCAGDVAARQAVVRAYRAVDAFRTARASQYDDRDRDAYRMLEIVRDR